jgi:hypothetical protein
MYVDSFSRTFLVFLATLVLTGCGGGGGGGGGTILDPAPDPDEEELATGSIELSVVFSDDNSGNILAGNERATLRATANEDGADGELVVRFSTTGGTLVDSTASTSDGIATVEIIGDGSGTPATVTVTVTLSDGTELSNEIIVQMSAAESSIELSIIFDEANEDSILAGSEQATLQAIVNEEGATDELVVRFSSESDNFVDTSAATSDGIATVEIFGDGSGTPATVTATVTLSDGTELSDEIIVQMSPAESSIELSIIFDEANEDSILAGSEQATLQAIVNEEGATDELVVQFSTTGGTLVETSASTSDGIATVEIVGDGSGTPATVTATVTLSDGTELSNEIIVQMSPSEDSMALSVIFDGANDDNILAGNERATLQAIANEEGATGELVVRFSTTGGTLVETSAATIDGVATVEIIGDGSGTAAVVIATATLSDGTEISDEIIVQMSPAVSSDISSIELSIIFDEANQNGVLAGNERATLQAIANEEGSTDELVVRFSTTGGTLVGTSAATSDGIATIDFIGDGSGTPATVTATVTLSDGTEISDNIVVQMSPSEDSIALSIIFDDASGDDILAGNERATLQAIANEQGATGELIVNFSTTGGTLGSTSAATSDGIATIDIIGDGSGTPATVTATVTLSDGTEITDDLTLQMSSDKPEISIVVRNINGASVTQFDSNVELTAEATVVDWDGGPLEGDDTELAVTFTLGAYADITNASAVTAFAACPVVLMKENTDCAFINFTSSTTAGTGDVIASATINGINIEATLGVLNTGTSGGIPDQNSFNITRIVGGNSSSESATVAIEGDEYNDQQATIRVKLGDFQENPVPDGAIVQFRTELGSITPSCEILNGTCEATFASGEPRSPTNSGVSFRNLDGDNCPSNYIEDEQVTVTGGTTALTDYRVANVLRVRQNNSPSIFTEGNQYTVNSNGIDCNGCANGQVLQITYQRLWLDEENDGSTAHVMLTPGTATEPFLDVQSEPCFANSRGNLEGITGSIEPAASTTVIGIGTRFLVELAVGDRIKVGNEVRTVASIANDTSLAVTAAFTAATNDTSPERMAAPAYLGGLGQPYGARSTILAWTQGEESFDDTNANGQYDFGEAFNDLPEAFLDKNEDGVLDDNNGDSASAGTFPTTTGPYRDAGLGTNAPANSDARQKNNPYCYGPETIVGESGDGNDSTEANKYCYQDGGEEEDFIDVDGNGLMDAGNGIYNGSRCINPEQNGETVCTTDLIDVRRETLVTLAGSGARTSFRATGANGLGGTFGSGEIIQGIENRSGIAVVDNPGLPTTWTAHAAPEPTPPPTTIVPTTLSNNLAGSPMGGAQIDTTVLNRDSDSIDNDEEVSLFTITNPFSRTQAIYEVSFEFAASAGAPRVGAIDLFINGVLQIDDCTSLTPALPVTCTVSGLTGDDTGDLLFVVGKAPAGSFSVVGTVHNVQITGTTTGTDGEFRSTESLISNNNMSTNLTEFNIDEDLNINTVFPGVSERKAPSGNVPGIFTTQTSGVFWFTDRFNGQLPDGTTVQLSSAATTGCQLTSAGGRAITTDTSDTFNVGTEVGIGLSFSVAQGGGGGGAIIATVTTPIGNQTSDSISCNLLN